MCKNFYFINEISCIVSTICLTVIACIFIIMLFKTCIVVSNNKSKKKLLELNTDHQKKMKEMEYEHKKEIEELKLK